MRNGSSNIETLWKKPPSLSSSRPRWTIGSMWVKPSSAAIRTPHSKGLSSWRMYSRLTPMWILPMENSQRDSVRSGVLLQEPSRPVFPAPSEEIGRLDLGVGGNHVFEREGVVCLEPERFSVQARGRRQVGERALHREEASFSAWVARRGEDGNRRRLARDIERDGAPGAGTDVQLRAGHVGMGPRDRMRGQRVEILAESDAESVIVGAAELDFG